MADYLAQFAMHATTGLAADDVVNTFHFTAPDDLSAGAWAAAAFPSFYEDAHAASDRLTSFLSSSLDGTYTCKVYNLGTAPPRVPFATFTGPITVGGATLSGLPEEVSLCLSYKATAVAGVSLASLRGRIYIGPFNVSAISGAGSGDTTWPTPPRPATTLITSMWKAGQFLAGLATSGGDWVVYSPTLLALGATHTHPVVAGFVDNAFDTIRRRGVSPTARTTW